MSVIAVKIYPDAIRIAGDSIRVQNDTQLKNAGDKLFQTNNSLITIGITGKHRDICLLNQYSSTNLPEFNTPISIIQYMAEFQSWARDILKNKEYNISESDFIIIYNKKAFNFYNFSAIEIKDYFAIGAGKDFALAALYLGKTELEAVRAACELCTFCEAPINTFTIPI